MAEKIIPMDPYLARLHVIAARVNVGLDIFVNNKLSHEFTLALANIPLSDDGQLQPGKRPFDARVANEVIDRLKAAKGNSTSVTKEDQMRIAQEIDATVTLPRPVDMAHEIARRTVIRTQLLNGAGLSAEEVVAIPNYGPLYEPGAETTVLSPEPTYQEHRTAMDEWKVLDERLPRREG